MTDPSKEISLDMFGPYVGDAVTEQDEVEKNPPLCWCGKGYGGHDPAHDRLAGVRITQGGDRLDPAEQARVEHERMVAGAGQVPPEPPTVATEVLPLPTAMIYPSRRDGRSPHVVTLALWHCTCEAAVLGNRDCWAIKEAKRLFEGAR
jgi:hypothetical protein